MVVLPSLGLDDEVAQEQGRAVGGDGPVGRRGHDLAQGRLAHVSRDEEPRRGGGHVGAGDDLAVPVELGEPFDEEDFYGALKEAVGLCADEVVAARDDPWHAAVDCYLFNPAVERTAVGEASDGSPVFRYMDVGGHYLDQIAVRRPDAGDGEWDLPEAESFFTLPGGFQAAHV